MSAPYYYTISDVPLSFPSKREVTSIANINVNEYLLSVWEGDGPGTRYNAYKVIKKSKTCVYILFPTNGGPPDEIRLRLSALRRGERTLCTLSNKTRRKAFADIVSAADVTQAFAL
jgi:hypothetical protein